MGGKDARERCAEKPNEKTKKTEETVCNHGKHKVIIMTYDLCDLEFLLLFHIYAVFRQQKDMKKGMDQLMEYLEGMYFSTYGYSFPPTGACIGLTDFISDRSGL